MASKSFRVKNSLNIEPQAVAPSSPEAGDLYVDTTGNLNIGTTTGSFKKVGAAAGGINYLVNSNKSWDFEDGVATGWGAYADAAAVSPVDGTGGSPNITFAASASAPLRGSYSALLTKDAANRQGQGVSVDFSIDNQEKSRPFQFNFDTSASANYTGSSGTEYARVYCYDVTAGALLDGYWDIGAGINSVKGFFIASANTSYRFIIHISGTGTSAWTLKVDNVTIGPSTVVATQVQSPNISVVRARRGSIQTLSSGTEATIVFDSETFDTIGEYNNGTGVFTATMPGKYDVSTNIGIGTGAGTTITAQSVRIAKNRTGSDITVAIHLREPGVFTTPAGTNGPYVQVTGSIDLAVGDTLEVRATLTAGSGSDLRINTGSTFSINRIIESSVGGVTADRAPDEFASNTSSTDANDTTSFFNGPEGAAGVMGVTSLTNERLKRVRFLTPILPTDLLTIEVKKGLGPWIRVSEAVYQDGIGAFQYQVSNAYGIGFQVNAVNSTDVDVVFGRYAYNNSTYGATGVSWTTASTYKWRVRKSTNGAIGFPINIGNVLKSSGSQLFYKEGTIPFSASGVFGTINYTRVGRVVTMTLRATGTISGNPYAIAEGVSIPSYADIAPTADTESVLSSVTCVVAGSRTRCFWAVYNQSSVYIRFDIIREDGASWTNGNSFATGDLSSAGAGSISITYLAAP